MWNNLADEWNAFVEWGEKEVKDDTSNSLGRNSVSGGIDNDFNNGQTTETLSENQ